MIPIPENRIKEFEKLGYGMFVHYGLYSQLGRGEWVMNRELIPFAEYVKLKDTFAAKNFDGTKLAKLARKAGMKYICLTARHHDGFSLYDTNGLNDYDAPHSPAGRDLVEDFVNGCRTEGIIPIFYHTTLDWSQESYRNNFDDYLKYLRQSIEILCKNYGSVGGFWFDGNWDKPESDWQEDELYGVIRKYQPEAIIVNNTGLHERGKAGHSEIDVMTFERGRPDAVNREGMSKYLAAEMCLTMNQHWAIGVDDFNYLSPKEIIESICACRKVGANFLLNVGPAAEGEMPAYEETVLLRVGQWMNRYADILSEGKPSSVIVVDDKDFVLEYNGELYLFVHNLPISGDENVVLGKSSEKQVTLSNLKGQIDNICWLDNKQSLNFTQDTVQLTGYPYGTDLVVRVAKFVIQDNAFGESYERQ